MTARIDIQADVFALDGSVRLTAGEGQPAFYADLFADVHAGPVWISAGYRFSNEQERDQWAAGHVALGRVTWVARRRGGRAP